MRRSFAFSNSQNKEIKVLTFAEKKAEQIRVKLYEYCKEMELKIYFQVDDLSYRLNKNNPDKVEFLIEPVNYKGDKLDGMQILYCEKSFEVSEFQAGPNNDNLYIYKNTTSLKIALKDLLKGNKRKPIQIW